MPVDVKLAFRPAEGPAAPAAKRGAPPEQRERPQLPFDVPATRSDAPREQTSAPQKVQSPPRPWIRWALFAVLPLALIAGAYWYVAGGQVMSTDDAYVEADTVGISTDVPGIVEEVDVTNNQHVEPGQVLYRLDPQQFQIALDNAKASLSQTALTIESMKQDYQRMLSDAAAQEGQVALDQATFDRNAALLPSGSTSKATYDQARYTLEVDKNKLESLRQQAAVQLARLAGDANIPATRNRQHLP